MLDIKHIKDYTLIKFGRGVSGIKSANHLKKNLDSQILRVNNYRQDYKVSNNGGARKLKIKEFMGEAVASESWL